MNYQINNTQNRLLATLSEKDSILLAGLILAGRGLTNYGEILNENLIKLLEKFSNGEAPVNGLIGQLWYDPDNDVLQIKTSTGNADNTWRSIGTPTVSPGPPTNPAQGDLWYNSTPRRGQLKIWINNAWRLIGPNNLPDAGVSGVFIDQVDGNTVIKILIDSLIMAIVCDQQINLSQEISGFPLILYPGLNLRTNPAPISIKLESLSVTGSDILPDLDVDVDIGTASLKFNQIYAQNFVGKASSASQATSALSTDMASTSSAALIDLGSTDNERYPIFFDNTVGTAANVRSNIEFIYQPLSNTLTVEEIRTNAISNTAVGNNSPFEVTDDTLIPNLRSETASRWHTSRTLSFSGAISGNATIDGSANITINTTINNNTIQLGTNTTGNYIADINQVSDSSITVSGTGSENNTVTVTNIGVTSLTPTGPGIATNNTTGSVTVNNTGVISINDDFADIEIPVRSYVLSRPSSAVGTTSRTVYLIPGYWQLTLETQAVANDTDDHYFTVTQTGTLGSSTASAGITFSKKENSLNPGAGATRVYHGGQLGIGSLQVASAGNYTMSISAQSITGSPGGSLASGPNAIFRAELISGEITGDIGTVTVGTIARPPDPPYDPPDTGGGWDSNSCLAFGTLITMADGTSKPVEQLAVGDVVKSLDIEGLDQDETWHHNWSSNEWAVTDATAVVKAVKSSPWYRYCDINEGFLLLTNDHKLLIKRNDEYSFKPAAAMAVGDYLYGLDGQWIRIFSHKRVYDILNFVDIDVEESDVYFANGVLSHNDDGDGDPSGGNTGGPPPGGEYGK